MSQNDNQQSTCQSMSDDPKYMSQIFMAKLKQWEKKPASDGSIVILLKEAIGHCEYLQELVTANYGNISIYEQSREFAKERHQKKIAWLKERHQKEIACLKQENKLKLKENECQIKILNNRLAVFEKHYRQAVFEEHLIKEQVGQVVQGGQRRELMQSSTIINPKKKERANKLDKQ